jgi:hypothetical protein
MKTSMMKMMEFGQMAGRMVLNLHDGYGNIKDEDERNCPNDRQNGSPTSEEGENML